MVVKKGKKSRYLKKKKKHRSITLTLKIITILTIISSIILNFFSLNNTYNATANTYFEVSYYKISFIEHKKTINKNEKIISEKEKKNEKEKIEPISNPDNQINKIGVVAFTFDDGPNKKITPLILKILKENEAHATFFVLGNKVKNNSDIIKQIVLDGHEIGIHGYNHTSFFKLSSKQIENQIKTTSKYIYEITNINPTLVRPPYRDITIKIAQEIDYPIILWSIDTNDWKNIKKEKIIEHVLSNIKDGSIILFHDEHKKTVEVNEILIPKIKEMGYDIVTVSKLFELNNIALKKGKIYGTIKK